MSGRSVLGDDPFAAGGKPAADSDEGEESAAPKPEERPRGGKKARSATKEPPRPKKRADRPASEPGPVEPSQPLSAPPLEDGAAARRAARATSSMEPVPSAAAAPAPPPGRLIRRPAPAPSFEPQDASALERAGRGYSRWMSELRMRDRSDAVDEFGYDPIFAERWRPLLEFLYRSYWRVETSGIENLPDHDQAMIVANHAGTFPYDGAMIMSAVKYDHPAHRDVRPLVEDFIFHFPFLGVALNRIGCVRACPENAERLLRHGGLVVVFPEGIKGIGKLYRQRYQLQRFGRGGFVKLALQTRTPIIPAAVIGAEEIHPMLAKVTWLAKYLGIPYVPLTPTFPWLGPLGTIPLPTKWQIRFGEPLDFSSQHGPGAAQDRVLVNRLTEQVRSTLQGMIDEALLGRRSVLFG